MKRRFQFFLLLIVCLALLTVQPVNAAGYILPFRSGTSATFGELGVHDCGFGKTGWKAVDLLPAENQVYASVGGDVSYVCRDGTQVALQIGDTLYTHLVDTGQQVGQHYNQGQAMGPMVSGTFNTACGYADQQANHYHVHFCFVPDGSTWSADGYTLNVYDSTWSKDGKTISPTGTLVASWSSTGGGGGGGSGPGNMFNIWDWLLKGLVQIAIFLISAFFPVSDATFTNVLNFTEFFQGSVWAVFELTWAALSVFRWWYLIPAIVFNVFLLTIQIAISAWLLIKSILFTT